MGKWRELIIKETASQLKQVRVHRAANAVQEKKKKNESQMNSLAFLLVWGILFFTHFMAYCEHILSFTFSWQEATASSLGTTDE